MVRVGGPRHRFGSSGGRSKSTSPDSKDENFHITSWRKWHWKRYRKVKMEYSLSVVVPAVDFSPAGVAQVEAPVRGQLIHRVEVQRVFVAADFADFRSRSFLLLLHMQVTSCEACMRCAPVRDQSCGAVLGHPHGSLKA